MKRSILAVTVGEPAGIGPEIALRAAWVLREQINAVLIGDAAFLALLAEKINPEIVLSSISYEALFYKGLPQFNKSTLVVIDVPLKVCVTPGSLDVKNSESVLKTLDVAIEGVQKKYFDAMVTAPIQKSIINAAGIQFSGHTEYLAQQTNTPEVVMMLAGENALQPGHQLRVALATTHVALKEVSHKINKARLLKQLQIIYFDLKTKFGFSNPHIVVAGLNPHAGEGGYLGREEIEEIAPAIAAACVGGMRVSGPYPADTLFLPHSLEGVDCVLAMYHDQGLPVLKFASFGHGVNVTLGLPFVRTSVDHGTALDVAKKGVGYAESGSMEAAMLLAAQMVGNQV